VRRSIILVLLAICMGLGAYGLPDEMTAQAQQTKGKHPPAAPKAKDGGVTGSPRDGGLATESAAGGRTSSVDSGIVEQRTLDGGTRVFKFGELEVEGRLRSPQIVYFLRRVRAEFAAGDLGHRSFLGELSQTRNASAF
jgi:hypothetical protein